jgi:S1-C subfamily serine protease
MEERHRDDGFEATFVVSTERSDAWKLLAGAEPALDGIGSPRAGQWWIPGVEGPADEVEVVPEELLRVRKATMPCRDTEIVITLEDAETGTRITVVQSGFGPGFATQRPWLEAGWWAIRADLFVFFEHGLSAGRHLRPWASIGCTVVESPGGLLVAEVQRGGLADQAGVAADDLILTLAGAPVVSVRDLAVAVRVLRSGAKAEVRFARGDEVRGGTGTL